MNPHTKIVNIVISTSLDHKIPLERLIMDLPNTEYNPEQFPGLIMKIREPRASFLIFSSGKVVCTGTKSLDEVELALERLIEYMKKVDIDIIMDGSNSYIRIVDTGIGMSQEDVINRWLRIGFSTKRIEKKTKKERRKTGEKGIGRLSADRLGSTISLVTKSNDSDIFGLEINWDDFNKQGIWVFHCHILRHEDRGMMMPVVTQKKVCTKH